MKHKLQYLVGLLRQKDGGLMGDLTVNENGYLLRMWRGQNGNAEQIDKLLSFSTMDGITEAGLKLIVQGMRESFVDDVEEGEHVPCDDCSTHDFSCTGKCKERSGELP